MAPISRTVENPVTGERFTFVKTGELLQIEFALAPGPGGPPKHRHPRQEERLTVRRGQARFSVAGREFAARAGDAVTVAPGEPHQFRNTGPEELHLLVEFRPAYNQEKFFVLFCQLGQEGKTNRKGIPHPFLGAILLRAFVPDNAVSGVPIPLQRVLVASLYRLGRLLGYGRRADEVRRRAIAS